MNFSDEEFYDVSDPGYYDDLLEAEEDDEEERRHRHFHMPHFHPYHNQYIEQQTQRLHHQEANLKKIPTAERNNENRIKMHNHTGDGKKQAMSNEAEAAKKVQFNEESKTRGLEESDKAFEESFKAKDFTNVEQRDKTKMFDPDEIKKALTILENDVTGLNKDLKTLSDSSKSSIQEMKKLCKQEDNWQKHETYMKGLYDQKKKIASTKEKLKENIETTKKNISNAKHHIHFPILNGVIHGHSHDYN